MMRVQTKAYGPVEVDERQKIRFPEGIYGFEKFKDYALLDANQQPFYWLQSLEVPEIAFILINPFLFRPDYEPDIDDQELHGIGLDKPQDALVFAIVTVPAQSGPMTANLQGPVVINRNNQLGIQAISRGDRWKVKHDVMAELAASRKQPC
jgi:flagellar assembly factor FliW